MARQINLPKYMKNLLPNKSAFQCFRGSNEKPFSDPDSDRAMFSFYTPESIG